MSKPAPEVFDEALALSEEDRGKLAEKLVESVDGSIEPNAEEAWTAEIQRRLARIEAGQAKSLSMSEAVARLRRASHER
jgi:putative addiction module component (TIGR02574 family)